MATTDAATAMVESIINGNVLEQTYTSEVQLVRIASRYLPLTHGPVTAVSSVKVGDATTALTAGDADGYTVDRFGLTRTYPYEWPAGKVTVTYTTGWASSASHPTAISEAITILEDVINAKPGLNAASISVGDESVTLRDTTGRTHAAPPEVMMLLRKWIKRDA